MHFMKPVWHSLTANLLPLAVPFSLFFLFLFLTFVFNHHLFSLTSLFPLFTSPSPVLFLATISFPLLSSPSFLCSALLLIFCPIHEVLLPEGVFKLHPAKKKKKKRHHKTLALASHNSPSAISSDFVCMILWGDICCCFFFFFLQLIWWIMSHFCSLWHMHVYFKFAQGFCVPWPIKGDFCVCYIIPLLFSPSTLTLYPPPPSFWPISIVAPPHWQPCISSSLPYVKVSG